MAGSGDGYQFKIGNQASQTLGCIHRKSTRVLPANGQHRAGNLGSVCPYIEGNGFENLGFMLRVAFKDGRFRVFFEQSALQIGLHKILGPVFEDAPPGSKAFQCLFFALKRFAPATGRLCQRYFCGQAEHSHNGHRPQVSPG